MGRTCDEAVRTDRKENIMKTWSVLAVALGLAVGIVTAGSLDAGQQQDRDRVRTVTGKWTMTLQMSMGTATPALELKEEDGKITGTYTGRYGTFPLQGSREARAIAFSFNMDAEGQAVTMYFAGELAEDGETMAGTAMLGGMGEATWTAKREAGNSR
jgi:hypothetical protein